MNWCPIACPLCKVRLLTVPCLLLSSCSKINFLVSILHIYIYILYIYISTRALISSGWRVSIQMQRAEVCYSFHHHRGLYFKTPRKNRVLFQFQTSLRCHVFLLSLVIAVEGMGTQKFNISKTVWVFSSLSYLLPMLFLHFQLSDQIKSNKYTVKLTKRGDTTEAFALWGCCLYNIQLYETHQTRPPEHDPNS